MGCKREFPHANFDFMGPCSQFHKVLEKHVHRIRYVSSPGPSRQLERMCRTNLQTIYKEHCFNWYLGTIEEIGKTQRRTKTIFRNSIALSRECRCKPLNGSESEYVVVINAGVLFNYALDLRNRCESFESQQRIRICLRGVNFQAISHRHLPIRERGFGKSQARDRCRAEWRPRFQRDLAERID